MTARTFLATALVCAIAAATVAAQTPTISLITKPSPLLLGQNRFEVNLKDASGQPIADADVVVTIRMPANPAINHPEMRSEARLTPVGPGTYSGIVMVTMAGAWRTEIAVRRAGKVIGQKTVTLSAQERVTRPKEKPRS